MHPAGLPPANSPFEAEDDHNFTTDAEMACRAETSGHVNLKTPVLNLPVASEVPFCEQVTGTALQVPLEMLRLFDCFKCDVNFDLPRHRLGSMGAFPRVVIGESLPEVCCMANVTLVRMAQALNHFSMVARIDSRAAATQTAFSSVLMNG